MKDPKSLTTKVSLIVPVLIYAGCFLFYDEARKAAAAAIGNCLYSLLPTVFPVMIASSFLNQAIGDVRKKGKPHPAFAEDLLCCFTGVTGGYPIGVQTSLTRRRSGLWDSRKAKTFALVNVHPGLGFTLMYVGKSRCGSLWTGVILFACVTLGNCISYFFIRLFSLIFRSRQSADQTKEQFVGHTKVPSSPALVKAVNDSITACLKMCGWIVFFSAVSAMLSSVLHYKQLVLFLEVTQAVDYSLKELTLPYTSFALAFGGISVYLQLYEGLRELGINAKEYLAVRAFSGIVSALITFAAQSVFHFGLPTIGQNASVIRSSSSALAGSVGLLFMCITFMISLSNTTEKAHGNR